MEENNANTAEDDLPETRWRRDVLRLRLAFEAGHITSIEWDIKRDEVRRFISNTQALPLTPEDKPITFHEACQNIYHEDRESFIANVQAALKHEQGHYSNEFRVINPETGEFIWLSATGLVEFDDEGQPAYLIGFSRDVTAQKKAELELRESERRYAGIVESAMDAIITVDSNQCIVLFNAAAEKMFGCLTSEVIGQPIDRFIPERFQQEHRQYIENFAHSGAANRKMGKLGLVVGRRANGEEFPAEASISQVGADGDKYFTAILRDVSLRKKTADKLVESEALLKLFVKHAPASIAMFDHNMCYLAVSNRWKEDFSLPLDVSLEGCSHYDVFPEIPGRWKDIHNRALNGETLRSDEDLFERKDGSQQWVKWEVIPWEKQDGQVGGILMAVEEITERIQAKKALRESRDDLALAQSVGQTGSWRVDMRNKVINWSAEEYRILGVPEDVKPTYGDFFKAIHPDDQAFVDEQWQAFFRGGSYDVEHRIVVDGEVRWVREKAYLDLDENGVPVGALGITQDITTRKLAELALKEADSRKNEFLAMLAHELRNPLAPISNAVKILRMTQQGNPTIEQTTGMISRQVRHLVRLVDDLLDVSRVSRGKIKLQKEPVDLVEIIRQAIETSQPLIDSRGHTLKVCLPPRAVRVEGDATRLAQVISNLLNNAAKYTDAGGAISLGLELQSGNPPDSARKAVIRIKDSGRGMEPAALENLFNIFYQADRNLDRADGGLGIGLYLVKSLVTMQGGQVQAFSEGRGKGSEFVIHLPYFQEQQLEDAVNTGTKVKPTHRKRILLVDDNPDVADSMAMLLNLFGHDVIIAHDGREAVNIALQEKPEIVLLDIGLPGMNGYEACRAMRKGGLTQAMIVALTGYGQEEDRKMALKNGFDHHLAKPVDLDVLEKLLATSLGM